MRLLKTPIADLMVAETDYIGDHRGAFARLFCAAELAMALGERRIVQINHSRTSQPGAIRGMHFQHAPAAEMKMVRCLKGRVFDVAVDLRAASATFLQWYAVELSEDNARMLVIPEGFAHGFQVLEPESELLYLHTAFYTPALEGGVRYDDPQLSIDWPLSITDISARDQAHTLINDEFSGVQL